jgi:hypothetical protein
MAVRVVAGRRDGRAGSADAQVTYAKTDVTEPAGGEE